MALVDYSSSDSDVEASNALAQASLKRKRGSLACPEPPPPPASFHDLYASTVRTSTSDDPSLHGGRKRTVPHVEGIWPSHVYLEWHPSAIETELINETLANAKHALNVTSEDSNIRLHSLTTSDLGVPLPLHISLSCSLPLATNQRRTFLDDLTVALRSSKRLCPFDVKIEGLRWVSNFENNRWFLVLVIKEPPKDNLNSLLKACNTVSSSYGLPLLYQEQGLNARTTGKKPRFDGGDNPLVDRDFSQFFHFSIAWTIDKVEAHGGQPLGDDDKIPSWSKLKDFRIHFDSVKVKLGNAIESISLEQGDKLARGALT